ncbi:hypothetical protein HanRHA438_Chr08g0361841 [Helianthus annuus]|nr:hypothetical protein HanRHA438_Chr08g0361841 [Helianthus annuus]
MEWMGMLLHPYYCSPFYLKVGFSFLVPTIILERDEREREIGALFYNGSQVDDDARSCHRRSVVTEPQKTPPLKP